MNCKKYTEVFTSEFRLKVRKSDSLFRKYKLVSTISIPFLQINYILDMNDDQSINQFEVLTNTLTSIDCPKDNFQEILLKVVNFMNKRQSIERGITIILSLFSKMNTQQKDILFQTISQSILSKWIDLSLGKALEFLIYLCHEDQKWKQKINIKIIQSFIFSDLRIPSAYYSSLLLKLIQQLFGSQSFTQSWLQSIHVILLKLLKQLPHKALKFISDAIDHGYIQFINELQINHNVLLQIYQVDRHNSHILLIRYLSILKMQDVNFGNKQYNMLSIISILEKLNINQCLDELKDNQRTCFYRFLSRFIRTLKDELLWKKQKIQILQNIRQLAIEYETNFGSEQLLTEAENIEVIEL